mmetsp:Transcript_11635/g.25212  ORF Transcript_11635/g.25212 Transcript_11635/m.25212 type:complete len:693 (+) Transcript_11635:116-2194(+)
MVSSDSEAGGCRRWRSSCSYLPTVAVLVAVAVAAVSPPTATGQPVEQQPDMHQYRYLRKKPKGRNQNYQPQSEPLVVGILQFVAQDGYPFDAFPLMQCQGNCNVDTDCYPPGLICYQRDDTNDIFVPGCIGPASEPVQNVNYCVDPRYLPDEATMSEQQQQVQNDQFAGVPDELVVSTLDDTPDAEVVEAIGSTPNSTAAPTDVPSNQPSWEPTTTYPSPFPTTTPSSPVQMQPVQTSSTCTVCTNISPDSTKACSEINLDDYTKCIYDDVWAAEWFCQYSCYVANQSYSSSVECCDMSGPTASPSPMPTTSVPSILPTQDPTVPPATDEPSRSPTPVPSTKVPTKIPTDEPTESPTSTPTRKTCDTGRLSTESTDVIFPVRSSFDGRSFPCYESESSSDPIRGVFYVKIPKTDSTYWKTVGVRTIYRMETSVFNNRECSFLGGHNTALSLNLKERVPEQTFAYTFIRDPRDWVVRRFYFRKSLSGRSTGEDAMMQYLQKEGNMNEQAKYIAQQDFRYYEDMSNPVAAAKDIVGSYDFIGLVEESAKSLVLMQLLLGLDKFDILYHRSPLAGTITYFKDDNDRCGRVMNESPPQRVDEYLDSTDWYRNNAVEVEIYSEVRKTIEATIDRIGRDRFDEALCEHKALMDEFQSFADGQCTIRYQCEGDGVKFSDRCKRFGCDYDCLEQFKQSYS